MASLRFYQYYSSSNVKCGYVRESRGSLARYSPVYHMSVSAATDAAAAFNVPPRSVMLHYTALRFGRHRKVCAQLGPGK